MQRAEKKVQSQADEASQKSSARPSAAPNYIESSPYVVAQRQRLRGLFGEAAVSAQAGDQVVQCTFIEEVAAKKGIAIVGENHGPYDDPDPELKNLLREAERAACKTHSLDYRIEHDEIPVALSAPSKSTSPARETKTGTIQPDDRLLRLGDFAVKTKKILRDSDDQILLFNQIKIFHGMVREFKGGSKDSLLTPGEIQKLKKRVNDAQKSCDRENCSAKSLKHYYLPIVHSVISKYKSKIPSFIKDDARSIDAKKEKSGHGADDIASARRSMSMLHTVARWAERIKPTVYKVGGEHVEDMYKALRMHIAGTLETELPPSVQQIRLVTDDEAEGQFEEADRAAFERMREKRAKIEKTRGTPTARGDEKRQAPPAGDDEKRRAPTAGDDEKRQATSEGSGESQTIEVPRRAKLAAAQSRRGRTFAAFDPTRPQ